MKIEDVRIGQRFKCRSVELAKSFGVGTAIQLSDDGDVMLRNEMSEMMIVKLDDLIPESECKSDKNNDGGLQEYTVSMRVDGRVNVIVKASSFDEAFELAEEEEYDPTEVECIEYTPVNATDSHGTLKDYH